MRRMGEEDAAREEAGHGALSHHRAGGSDERREDAGDKRPVRALRALLHHHESCPEVVKLCARYGVCAVHCASVPPAPLLHTSCVLCSPTSTLLGTAVDTCSLLLIVASHRAGL